MWWFLLAACMSPTEEPPESSSETNQGSETAHSVHSEPPAPEPMAGVWVTRWTWSSPSDIDEMFDELAGAGFNAVFFQVRGTFDAYYASSHEPWAARLSGVLGKDPGWDPLAHAIDAAHQRGMALHAYLNAFPMWSGEAPPASVGIPHALETADWRVAGPSGSPDELAVGEYTWSSPGIPAVRARLAAVADEIDANYDVDGIHLDLIRYPRPDSSYDITSNTQLAQSELERAAWQVEQVNAAVNAVDQRVASPVTAAVWGVHTNHWSWPNVSEGLAHYYQDSHRWTQEGWASAIVPMIYWPVTQEPGARLDFDTLIADHVARASGPVWAGVGNGLTIEEVNDCLRSSRERGAEGFVLFDWSLYASRLSELDVNP